MPFLRKTQNLKEGCTYVLVVYLNIDSFKKW